MDACLQLMRIEYLPEIVEIGESSFFPSFTFNRLDNPHQGAGIALFKPVYPNDVVLHDLPLAGHSYITGEVTGRLQEEKIIRRRGDAGKRRKAKKNSMILRYCFVKGFRPRGGIDSKGVLENLPATVVDSHGFGLSP